ncbi:carbamoyl-phosphate synthase L chain, ATP binding domain-containing protein [Dunaliella salina]|uniref:Carbamoyl-phosphate synthase L chain, ATP binding domain-containing protein n=1 Tax=Dunaliella salina TaxID=3046 RepID=A0ABQ7GPS9_DUNSA|nr:carbamoyl-phosphate synthase L chain, ATP binding domain-containing protein [Dunaliella salina]|eukprot:KAF5836615.1 carbamoyl-phosphate synthase L chain, ATP binding domain-containing protein [Dunaliella salina]
MLRTATAPIGLGSSRLNTTPCKPSQHAGMLPRSKTHLHSSDATPLCSLGKKLPIGRLAHKAAAALNHEPVLSHHQPVLSGEALESMAPFSPFKKVLAANRGEIAIRIFRAGTELGLRTVAVYSPADRLQPHRYKADEAYQSMGDKIQARRAALECGVTVVPGTEGAVASADEAKAFADSVGYPLIMKAAMGGGGRGMRVVHSDGELVEAFQRASNEAKAAFGDGRMFIERYVEEPRHIEIQVLADNYGNVVHLYERDCSVQRRHQKVVEMAPSLGLNPKTRAALLDEAVRLVKHVGYRNAGTVEFMVDKEDRYYFLEVNPRVQVEHTVTEEITGIDIVQSQIRIAGGTSLKELGLGSQEDVPPINGFSIQCRVTSEDAAQNFQPDSGRLEAYRVPGGPGIRLDGAVTTGNVMSRYYDSMLAKVIASAPTFGSAVQKMHRALQEFQVRGIKTNTPFLLNVLRHPEFLAGNITTSFIEKHSSQLFNFEGHQSESSSKLLLYLANMVVNGPQHPGSNGTDPATVIPTPLVLLPDNERIRRDGEMFWCLEDQRLGRRLCAGTRACCSRTPPCVMHTNPSWLRACAPLTWWLRRKQPRTSYAAQMLLRGANAVGYTSYPDNAVDAFVREARLCGVDIFRVFDSLNYIDNLKFGVDSVRAAGGVAEATLCYTGDVADPSRTKYSLDYYVDLAQQLVDHGIHALAIKDMAGLLKPKAASLLVGALRARFPDLVIHVHTHDSAGTGVATQLAAAAAGADIIDCCVDSMSGTTSQPSMGAIVNSLHGTDLDTGINPMEILPLTHTHKQTRELYRPFESSMKAVTSDVYLHEMPGGQYTNLKIQANSLGLGGDWGKICKSYADANRALGDIVKVTPSSKVVGDLAQFMVQNDLDEESLVAKASELSFPSSVVEFFQGYLGQPPGGFPEPLCSRVLKGKPSISGRPGASLPPLNLEALEYQLREKYGAITKQDVLSAAMYPKVFDEFKSFQLKYGDLIEKLPTRAFLAPLEEDEEVEVEFAKGVCATIKYKAMGELQPNGEVLMSYSITMSCTG